MDLNLTVHKMGPMEGVASGTEAEVMGLLCSSETLALCGAGGDHARLSPSLIWTRLSQVGPGGHTTITTRPAPSPFPGFSGLGREAARAGRGLARGWASRARLPDGVS